MLDTKELRVVSAGLDKLAFTTPLLKQTNEQVYQTIEKFYKKGAYKINPCKPSKTFRKGCELTLEGWTSQGLLDTK